MAEQGLLGTFASHAFLMGLSDQHLMRLAAGVRPFTAAAREFLAREGERARAFYLIQAGQVEIGNRTGGDDFVPIVSVGPGEVVGWSWLLPPHRWQFDCRAVVAVQGLMFDAEWLREQCETDHELGYHLLKHLLLVIANRLAASRLAMTQPGALAPPCRRRTSPR
jgi:CRP-like cAMP-binding protein